MSLITLKNIQLAFGAAPILDGVQFSLKKGERICLIGRNGEGKSSLLKLIDGQQKPDDGEIILQSGIKIAMLAQDIPNDNMTVCETVLSADPALFEILQQYEALTQACADGNLEACKQAAQLQLSIDNQNGWDLYHRASALIEEMGLNPNDTLSSLSGGKKRRALLARALALKPDVLLLDEPTNHLDVESIEWLEAFLLKQNITVLFISHDRKFIDAIATGIIELDRGILSSYDISQGVGGFARYQELKAQEIASEQKSFAEFDKKLAQEEIWIRQGIKARRTRNEGRVRALQQLRQERKARRDVIGSVQLSQNNSEKSGKIVCESHDLTLAFDGRILVKNFSTTLLRGDKVGIIGKNGVGKTTLIKTLLGLDNSAQIGGSVKLGTNLHIAFFDQLKDQLNLDQSIADNVAEGSDYVEVDGKKKHIIGYLQDFLFTPARAKTPIKALSGGEKARVLLAKLLLKPANVLVLDEPTNDLDMATLELLEEFVVNFAGTVLLISHDRAFMDNVITQSWVFDCDKNGDGVIYEYVGGYDDYLNQHQTTAPTTPQKPKTTPKPNKTETKPTKRKLSYKESQELSNLPDEIAALELEQQTLHEKLADGSWFVSDLAAATAASERLQQIDEILLAKMTRWEELESI